MEIGADWGRDSCKAWRDQLPCTTVLEERWGEAHAELEMNVGFSPPCSSGTPQALCTFLSLPPGFALPVARREWAVIYWGQWFPRETLVAAAAT